MGNTYTQLYIHFVFAVKHREQLLTPALEEKTHKYIAGIIANLNQKLIAINGMPDHVHILLNKKPTIREDELVRKVKSASSKYINDLAIAHKSFRWQSGYGAFTCSSSEIDRIASYVHNQKFLHLTTSFKEEYKGFLRDFNIDHDERYLFDWLTEEGED